MGLTLRVLFQAMLMSNDLPRYTADASHRKCIDTLREMRGEVEEIEEMLTAQSGHINEQNEAHGSRDGSWSWY